MDEAARARAEAAAARRAKILARQKDRITSITGAYTGLDEQQQALHSSTAQPATTAARNTAEPGVSAPATNRGAAAEDQQQQLGEEQQRQMAALMAAVSDNLQRAQAVAQADQQHSIPPQQQQQAQDIFAQLLGGQAAAGTGAGPQSSSQQHSSVAGEQQQQQHPAVQQPVGMLLQLGPSLSLAVKKSQAFRLLSALLLAYAALSGWQMGLPPAVVLVVSDLSIVAAALLLLHSSVAGQALLAGQQQGSSGGDAGTPLHLRSFDFLSLVPGLRQLLTALAGYRQLADALSADVAAYLVALGLLTVVFALQPPLIKV